MFQIKGLDQFQEHGKGSMSVSLAKKTKFANSREITQSERQTHG
jgi:hypothetical protein